VPMEDDDDDESTFSLCLTVHGIHLTYPHGSKLLLSQTCIILDITKFK